jgi:hypothetical protein
MKTIAKYSLLFIMIITNRSLSAQTYKLVNNSPCVITADIDIIDASLFVCHQIFGQTINGNTSFNIPLGSCTTVGNIVITVTDFGGTTQTTVINFTNGSVGLQGCISTYAMQYQTFTYTFNVN